MKKTIAIIQARTGSTRLPGKILMDIKGKTVLEHVIQRVSQAEEINEIVIATTVLSRDDPVEELAIKSGVKVFRGSESNVLSRYFHAAKENHADIVVRITSDCPLYDPRVADEMIRFFKGHSYDIISNAGPLDSKRTYPPGFDTEIFSFSSLEEAFHCAKIDFQREHVTPYIYAHPLNLVYNYDLSRDCSKYRLTLDTDKDFELISRIYQHFYKGNHGFFMEDIIRMMDENPQLIEINSDIHQKRFNE